MMYGWIIGIMIVIVLIVALSSRVHIFQRNTTINPDNSARTSAMEILENRYANGEIDKAEFERKKTKLK